MDEAALQVLAARQRWVVTRDQLRACGLGESAVAHRIRSGRLHRVHRGVYAVGRRQLGPLGAETAALLACGPEACLSHRSAAALWKLLPPQGGAVEVTVPSGRSSRPGIRVHRADGTERTHRSGLCLTTPAQTVVDLAGDLRAGRLERLMAEAQATLGVRPEQVLALAARRPGAPALRAVLAGPRGPALTRSEAERRLLRLIRGAGLPPPRCNVRLAGYEVDFLWPQQKLVVEVDGYAFHSSPRAFERDHRKTLDVEGAGYALLRFTWRQITEEHLMVVRRLCERLFA